MSILGVSSVNALVASSSVSSVMVHPTFGIVEMRGNNITSSSLASSTTDTVTSNASIDSFSGKFTRRLSNGYAIQLNWSTTGMDSCDLYQITDTRGGKSVKKVVFKNAKPDDIKITNFVATKSDDVRGKIAIYKLSCNDNADAVSIVKTLKFNYGEKTVNED